MHLKAIGALCSLLLTAFAAGCTTATDDCSGQAGAGQASMDATGGSAPGSPDGGAMQPMSAAAAAGYSGGEAYASGGCGPCAGDARAGPGYAEVSGGCMGCEGGASAGAASASASGGCYGCTGEAEADAGADGSSGGLSTAMAASASGSCVHVPTKDISVYSFSGQVVGASPADPSGNGPITPTPIAKSDSFVLPNGTLKLMFTSDFSGSGSGRIEVAGPDGELVYQSADHYCAGAAGASGCTMQGSESQSAATAPGTYTVHYLVAGAADVTLEVVATVLAVDAIAATTSTEGPGSAAGGPAVPQADSVISLQSPLVPEA